MSNAISQGLLTSEAVVKQAAEKVAQTVVAAPRAVFHLSAEEAIKLRAMLPEAETKAGSKAEAAKIALAESERLSATKNALAELERLSATSVYQLKNSAKAAVSELENMAKEEVIKLKDIANTEVKQEVEAYEKEHPFIVNIIFLLVGTIVGVASTLLSQ